MLAAFFGRIYTRMIGESQQGKVNDEMFEEGDRAVHGRCGTEAEPKDVDT